jgi:hypothetical protein
MQIMVAPKDRSDTIKKPRTGADKLESEKERKRGDNCSINIKSTTFTAKQ